MKLVLAPVATALLVLTCVASAGMRQGPVSRSVAFTFDDLPGSRAAPLATVEQMTSKLMRTLTMEGVPATGFVNEINLLVGDEVEARTALLSAWLDAGFDLGNHTYSHVSIDRSGPRLSIHFA